MCNKYALLRQPLDTCLLGISSDAPSEVKDVVLEEEPSGAEILGHIQLLVNLAGVIFELSAVGPSGSQGPGLLSWVELKLMDLLP